MDDSSIDLKIKLGRKGDPRMHRAVLARLNNPDMSLHDALITGGFDYPKVDKNDNSSKYSLLDSDGTLLGQRKNQLSRRLREAKREIEAKSKRKEIKGTTTASADTSSVPAPVPVLSTSLKITSFQSSPAHACNDSHTRMSGSNVVSISQTYHQNNSSTLQIRDSIQTSSRSRTKQRESEGPTTASADTSSVTAPLLGANIKASFQSSLPYAYNESHTSMPQTPSALQLRDATHASSKKSKASSSSADSYESNVLTNNKDSDSFSIPTIPSAFDIESIFSYSTKPNQDMKSECLNKTEYDSQKTISSMNIKLKPCELSTNLIDEYNRSYGTKPKATESKIYHSDFHQRLQENELKKSADVDENDSVATNRSLSSRHVRNRSMLRKAIEIFKSDNHNYLQGIMKKSGYSPSESTAQNIEYLTFMAKTINSEIERFEQLKNSNCAFSCSSNNSCIPPKKRRHENSSISFEKVSLEGSHDTNNFESVDTRNVIYSSQKIAISRQNLFSREVAVKFLTKGNPSEEDLNLLQNEDHIAKSVSHPNIRESFGMVNVHSKPAVALEWIDGETIAEYEKCSNIEEFLSLATGIVSGLKALHEARILHRQININNVMVQRDKTIKIIGLGNAIRFNDTSFSSVGHFEKEGLDLRFISPEQTGRVDRPIDFRTDLYSLGLVFYYMLSGKCPFEADTRSELIRLHISGNPSAMGASIPDAIAKMVAKLMEKMAEDRFSSAKSVLRDLELLQPDKRLHSFESCTNYSSTCILLPQRLYGREIECSILSAALEKSCAGSLEGILITGPVGCGKSKLASSTSELVAIKGGYFISGECDHPHRGTPYSAIQYALTSFCDQILMESKAYRMEVASTIIKCVGRDIKILFDIIPNLRLIVGEINGVDDIFYGESLSLLCSVFIKFMECICSAKHPIVLHIDDMEYADRETLDLIEVLIIDTSIKYLLFIGSYSYDDVDSNHLITNFVKNIKGKFSSRQRIEIGDLSKENVNELVSNALRLTAIDAHPLTSIIMKKTKGNALFVSLYIRFLCKENLLRYCNDLKKWIWNDDFISEKNVLKAGIRDILVQTINKLNDRANLILMVACLIKAPFTKSTIYQICNDRKAVVQVFTEGLLIPCNSNPNLYRPVHSELKYAELSLLSDSQRRNGHLKIGTNLLRADKGLVVDDNIFDLTYHFNSAVDFFVDRSEHLEAAKLNLRAGQKAQSVGAYSLAVELHKVGIQCVTCFDWTEQYELKLKLYNGVIAASCHTNDQKLMNEALFELSENITSAIDMLNSISAQSIFLTSHGNYVDAHFVGKKFLDSIGVHLPSKSQNDILSSMISTEYDKTKSMYEDKSNQDILNMEAMVDKMAIATMMSFQDMITPCQMIEPELVPYIVLKQVQFTLTYGKSKYIAQIFSLYGAVLCSEFEEFKNGHRFCELAQSFLSGNSEFRPYLHIKVNETILTRLSHWMSHIHHSLENLLKLSETARISYMSKLSDSVKATYLSYNLWSGLTLPSDTDLFTKSINAEDDSIAAICQAYLNITGENNCGNPALLVGKFYNFDHFNDFARSPFSSFCVLFSAMFIAFIFRDYERAAIIIERYRPLIPAMKGTFQYALHYFYDGLISTFMVQMGKEDSKWMILALDSLEKLRKWHTQCPENFSSKYFLLEAEIANAKNDEPKSIKMFKEAISLAKTHNVIFEEALACERGGLFYLDAGYREQSVGMFSNACELYELWGSSPKVQQIHNLHPGLKLPETSTSHELSAINESDNVFVVQSAPEASCVSDLTFDFMSGKYS